MEAKDEVPFPPLLPSAVRRWLGLALLLRWVPVASWIGGGIAIGTGAALGHWRAGGAGPASSGERALAVALIAAAGVLLQGLAAHAWNDREDWRSGTDPANLAPLSGGSKAVHRRLLGAGHLTWTAATAVAAAGLIALHFTLHRGLAALRLWLIAVWAAAAYSLPPLRLAYRPLAGEWLCAWPAVVAGAVGTFYLLTGTLTLPVLAAGALHGLFCLAWLMQHHLADVPADLAAHPAKLTTPAWLYRWALTARP
ncbi:MAG TPA: prenyltransferase, partial [Firmicutes bacterium]|nr:prenyltransferase [Bacillota bacterium]